MDGVGSGSGSGSLIPASGVGSSGPIIRVSEADQDQPIPKKDFLELGEIPEDAPVEDFLFRLGRGEEIDTTKLPQGWTKDAANTLNAGIKQLREGNNYSTDSSASKPKLEITDTVNGTWEREDFVNSSRTVECACQTVTWKLEVGGREIGLKSTFYSMAAKTADSELPSTGPEKAILQQRAELKEQIKEAKSRAPSIANPLEWTPRSRALAAQVKIEVQKLKDQRNALVFKPAQAPIQRGSDKILEALSKSVENKMNNYFTDESVTSVAQGILSYTIDMSGKGEMNVQGKDVRTGGWKQLDLDPKFKKIPSTLLSANESIQKQLSTGARLGMRDLEYAHIAPWQLAYQAKDAKKKDKSPIAIKADAPDWSNRLSKGMKMPSGAEIRRIIKGAGLSKDDYLNRLAEGMEIKMAQYDSIAKEVMKPETREALAKFNELVKAKERLNSLPDTADPEDAQRDVDRLNNELAPFKESGQLQAWVKADEKLEEIFEQVKLSEKVFEEFETIVSRKPISKMARQWISNHEGKNWFGGTSKAGKTREQAKEISEQAKIHDPG